MPLKAQTMPKPLRRFLLAALICLLTSGVVFARAMQQGENCIVPADTVVQGSLFAFCQNLEIAGKVEGSVYGIGLRTTISGEIGSNVYIAGLALDLTGSLHGALHYIGLMLRLGPPASAPSPAACSELNFAALSFSLDAEARIAGAVTGFGYQALLAGGVRGEVNYWGSAFVVSGAIDGDAFATVGNPDSDLNDVETLLLPLEIQFEAATAGLNIEPGGRISGNLVYIGPVEGAVEGTVAGSVRYTSSTPVFAPELPQAELTTRFYDQFLRELTVLLTIGFLGLALAGKRFQYPLTRLRRRPLQSFVIGMLLFIISFPIALILLLATALVMLLPLILNLPGVALAAGAFFALVDICLVGMFYFGAIFVARALFALGIGRLALQVALGRGRARRMPRLSIIVGAALMALLSTLPAIGFVFNAGALFMGLGAIASASMAGLNALRGSPLHGSMAVEGNPGGPFDPQMAGPGPAPAGGTVPLLEAEQGLVDLPPGFDPDFFFADD